MTKIELSDYIRQQRPLTKLAIAQRNKSMPNKVFENGTMDLDYVPNITINNMKVLDPCWVAWLSIIDRCYNPYTVNKEPGYINVYVCNEWLTSCMSFREWWINNYVENYKIDKDILTDNQIYSPDTCLYVPDWLNGFATGSRNTKSNLPRGVHLSEAKRRDCKYVGEVLHPITKEKYWRASYSTPEQAHKVWVIRKLTLAEELKHEMDAIDFRVYPRVLELIQR